MKRLLHISLAFVLIASLYSCGGGGYKKSALDKLIVSLDSVPTYSIILQDMDAEGIFSNTYKQQFKIIKPVNGLPTETTTPFYEVSEREFLKYEDALGMTIVSKTDGKLKKEISPAGYSNYIGNSQYGQWRQGSNGSSFWEFYGRYAFMNSMFNLLAYPARRSYWNDYRNNYYSSGRSYYGPTQNGRTYYGTYGTTNQKSNSVWSKKQNTFKNRVNSRTSRSSSRSSSRYSGSSYRSRGGGFGK
ncbi:hypothetical protein [Aureibacter tunicatorum]|uniref:Uncharacterized protein n=1 Tax=Aureibacter tunicatorum TaxID=866807 RepID=A0AAE3XL77_9BACT|nr:hypothetical protein [Aureibacter tunicatorum]MDR6238653.1 hypothetical protein [Aureibacter tunicatorum]BDD05416.1 hypothetical protein AUTU_28990 [Aureibacter tunicatorum]